MEMNKRLLSLPIIAIAIVGVIYITSSEKTLEVQPQPAIAEKEGEKLWDLQAQTAMPAINDDPLSREKSASRKGFSYEEVAEFQLRNIEVTAQLDELVTQLNQQLETPEQRKMIEARYQQLIDEQNQLAIQLVKINLQASTTE